MKNLLRKYRILPFRSKDHDIRLRSSAFTEPAVLQWPILHATYKKSMPIVQKNKFRHVLFMSVFCTWALCYWLICEQSLEFFLLRRSFYAGYMFILIILFYLRAHIVWVSKLLMKQLTSKFHIPSFHIHTYCFLNTLNKLSYYSNTLSSNSIREELYYNFVLSRERKIWNQ